MIQPPFGHSSLVAMPGHGHAPNFRPFAGNLPKPSGRPGNSPKMRFPIKGMTWARPSSVSWVAFSNSLRAYWLQTWPGTIREPKMETLAYNVNGQKGTTVADYSLMKTTILLLVSDPVVRSTLKETLERVGYTVLGCRRPGAGGGLVEGLYARSVDKPAPMLRACRGTMRLSICVRNAPHEGPDSWRPPG